MLCSDLSARELQRCLLRASHASAGMGHRDPLRAALPASLSLPLSGLGDMLVRVWPAPSAAGPSLRTLPWCRVLPAARAVSRRWQRAMTSAPHAHTSPSLVQLGRLASWHPSPVSIHPLSHDGSVRVWGSSRLSPGGPGQRRGPSGATCVHEAADVPAVNAKGPSFDPRRCSQGV